VSISRRTVLRGLAGMSGAALSAANARAWSDDKHAMPLPEPLLSGIEHLVVVMMENRSFDHLLGWLPKADARQHGLKYSDVQGTGHRTYALAPDFTGCGHPDPDHSYAGGRIQYHQGAMDGFLLSDDDDYPIGYYTERDRPFFSELARHYTVLDRSFCSILGPTFPNRFFVHAAQTDRLAETLALATMPTIWDRLAAAQVSLAYNYSNLPFLGFWGLKYLQISRFYSQFLLDAALGQLPAVSFVEPRFTVLDDGTGNDDHPHADVRSGDAFLAQTFQAVASGPQWPSTVFIVTYDEWGGFFDHVPPPRAAAPNTLDPDLVAGKALLGFRVPTIIASPWTRTPGNNPRIDSGISDHTSILKLIEWRWGLAPLTARDASEDVQNLARVLDFDQPRVDVPNLPQPAAPPPVACPALSRLSVDATRTSARREGGWQAVLDSGLLAGWPLDGV
jgi:phospholipase C